MHILKLMDQGIRSTRKLAEKLGCSRGTVHNILKQLKQVGLVELPSPKVFALSAQGKAFLEIAKKGSMFTQAFKDFITTTQKLVYEFSPKIKYDKKLYATFTEELARYMMFGTFALIVEIIRQLALEITPQQMEVALEKMSAHLKQLLATVSTACLFFAASAWREFYRIGRDMFSLFWSAQQTVESLKREAIEELEELGKN